MSRRQSISAYAALLLAVAAFAASLVRPTSGQPGGAGAPAAVAGIGRYRTYLPSQNNATYVIVTDTATGRTWTHSIAGGNWSDFGVPDARQ